MDSNPAPTGASAPALTLFVLGAVVGLLSLLGRLGQEIAARALNALSGVWSINRAEPHPESLPPLLRALDGPGAALILAGFALSTLGLAAGLALWRASARPSTRRTRAWTRFMWGIAGSLWIGMGAAALIAAPRWRRALIVGPGAVALILFVAFVYLLFERQFLASAPPDDAPPA